RRPGVPRSQASRARRQGCRRAGVRRGRQPRRAGRVHRAPGCRARAPALGDPEGALRRPGDRAHGELAVHRRGPLRGHRGGQRGRRAGTDQRDHASGRPRRHRRWPAGKRVRPRRRGAGEDSARGWQGRGRDRGAGGEAGRQGDPVPPGLAGPVTEANGRRYVITFSCPDRSGIVARISGFLADAGGWITEAAYHTDTDTGWFFTRQVVRASSLPFDVDELRLRFSQVADELSPEAEWRVTDTAEDKRVVLLVTKEGHCLHDLLGRLASGELPARINAVIGNSEALRGIVEAHGL